MINVKVNVLKHKIVEDINLTGKMEKCPLGGVFPHCCGVSLATLVSCYFFTYIVKRFWFVVSPGLVLSANSCHLTWHKIMNDFLYFA
jgi:hypothetical protein